MVTTVILRLMTTRCYEGSARGKFPETRATLTAQDTRVVSGRAVPRVRLLHEEKPPQVEWNALARRCARRTTTVKPSLHEGKRTTTMEAEERASLSALDASPGRPRAHRLLPHRSLVIWGRFKAQINSLIETRHSSLGPRPGKRPVSQLGACLCDSALMPGGIGSG